jgi:C-5 cytosine-specific DNA methylase
MARSGAKSGAWCEKVARPLAIDLFCGLGGWTEGLLAEGYDVIGYDIEQHVYGEHRYPAELVIQDVRTLHGSQFRDAALIVASPPCQPYSYRAMPWKRAKALPPPDNELFDTCFRLQREACAAAGRHIPLVVENVRGAQKWVGRARWNFGSFYLWGDVPALMPMTLNNVILPQVVHRDPDGRKLPGFRFDGSGRSFQSASVEGVKQPGISGTRANGRGDRWFQDGAARDGSKSPQRKMASAMIAKIPLALSRHIARTYYPLDVEDTLAAPAPQRAKRHEAKAERQHRPG